LAERLGYDTVCIDTRRRRARRDHGGVNPKIHAMTGIDYREYYIQNTCGATRRMRSGQSGRPSNQ
jgi:hypothetical protein